MRQNGSIRGRAINPEVRARYGLSGRFDNTVYQARSVLVLVSGNVRVSSPLVGPAAPTAVQLLLVGGGGGGGAGTSSAWEAGGGGAGGAIYTQSYNVSQVEYTIGIGSGGSGGNPGTQGSNSYISTSADGEILTALGGGHGSSGGGSGASAGGCGGGGAHDGTAGGAGRQTTDTNISADSRTYGFGNAGINGGRGFGAGGGGTAASPTSQVGGAGISVDITGANVNYGGGGGGQNQTGGAGGGGSAGGAGGTNTGGGGGGPQSYNSYIPGGAGGSGVGIIRYSTDYANASFSGSNVEYSEVDGNRIYKFNAGGSLTFVDDSAAPASANLGY